MKTIAVIPARMGSSRFPGKPLAMILGRTMIEHIYRRVSMSKSLEATYIATCDEEIKQAAQNFGAPVIMTANTHERASDRVAEVFMGDVGALALGAALGVVAVIIRQEIILLIMGGIFVVETLSVILQVTSFKLTGKRILRMAPLHHHFELKGWKENQVVVRFWIITMMLVLLGLATLKLR